MFGLLGDTFFCFVYASNKDTVLQGLSISVNGCWATDWQGDLYAQFAGQFAHCACEADVSQSNSSPIYNLDLHMTYANRRRCREGEPLIVLLRLFVFRGPVHVSIWSGWTWTDAWPCGSKTHHELALNHFASIMDWLWFSMISGNDVQDLPSWGLGTSPSMTQECMQDDSESWLYPQDEDMTCKQSRPTLFNSRHDQCSPVSYALNNCQCCSKAYKARNQIHPTSLPSQLSANTIWSDN